MTSANVKSDENINNHFEKCLFWIQNLLYDVSHLSILGGSFIGFDEQSVHVFGLVKRCLINFWWDQVKDISVNFFTLWWLIYQLNLFKKCNIDNFTHWIKVITVESICDYHHSCYLKHC